MGNKSDKVTGKVHEGVGKVTGNPRREEKGRRKQMKSDVKKSGEKLKDAAKKL